jgi:hypothetical protein
MSLRDGADARTLMAGARISRGGEPAALRRNRMGAGGRPVGDSFPRKRMLGLERGPRSRPGRRRPAGEVRYGSAVDAAKMGRAADPHSTTAAKMGRAADAHSTTATEMGRAADAHSTTAAEMRRAADAHPTTATEMASASLRNSAATEMWRSAAATSTAGACASDVRYGACKNGCYCDDTESAGICHATLGRPPRVLSDVRR